MRTPAIFFSALLVVLAAASSVAADGPNNFTITDATRFTIQFTNDQGATVAFTEADASGPAVSTQCFGFSATRWVVPLGATGKDVHVTLYGTSNGSCAGVFYAFPTRIPTGWRTDWVQRHFAVGTVTARPAGRLRVVYPKVYGPTLYSLANAADTMNRYPTFLQTQQVTLEDLDTGECISLIVPEDRGRRKGIGFVSDGTGAIEFRVRFIPEQDWPDDPNPYGWVAPYRVCFGYFDGGFGEAIDWYRAQQLARPGSFLRSRLPAAVRVHPKLRAAKYVMAIGASASPVVLPNGQFDISPAYRAALLNTFGGLHGDGMLFYHLGWYLETPNVAPVLPDAYRAITPGHAALIAEADALDRGFGSVGYTLPGVADLGATDFAAGVVRTESDGSDAVVTLPGQFTPNYRSLTFWPRATTDLVAPTYTDMVAESGFAGAYLDALSAAPLSYSFAAHMHPRLLNEQKLGIDRLVRKVRFDVRRASGERPVLVNETPTDSLPVDGGALDTYTFLPNYANVFRMTYTGLEWPVFSLVWAIDDRTGLFGPSIYTLLLANALASGAKPLILWPEFQGLIPTDPLSDPAYLPFMSLLANYVANYDTFWKQIMEGRTYEALDPFDVVAGTVTLPTPAPTVTDLVSKRWRLPGWRPDPNGSGCVSPVVGGMPCRSIVHGVFEPAGQPGRRVVVVCRWTDPAIAQSRNAPSTHWMHNARETVTLNLCARNVCCAQGGGRVRLYDPSSRSYSDLGRLSSNRSQRTPFTLQFDGCGVKVICIDD